jgi:hypothetical protein
MEPMPTLDVSVQSYISYLENVVAVLINKFASRGIILSNEEIEDAPDIEVRNLFETDQIEFRASTRGKTDS